MAGANSNTFQHNLVVKDLVALAQVHIAELDFGTFAWCESVGDHFALTETPSFPPDGVNVIAPIPQAAVGKPGAAWQKGTGGASGGLIVEQDGVPLPPEPRLNFLSPGFSVSNNVGNSSNDVKTRPEGSTIAGLATLAGIDANTDVFVFDTAATYRWVPGGASPADGWTIVNGPGGQWDIQGSTVTLAPLGGGVDDWPRIFNPGGAAPAAAAAGMKVVFSPGTYTCNTPPTPTGLPSNLELELTPGVTINSTLPNGIGPTNTPFYAAATTAPATTLNADVVLNSRVFSVADTTALAPTTVMLVGSGNRFSYYTVVSRSVASGAGTVTVERPILWHFLNTSAVSTVSYRPTNIRLTGNGAIIKGTGDRAFEIAAATGCVVQGFRIDATVGFGSIVASFDVGGYDNHFEDIQINGGFDAQGGIAIESNEGSSMNRIIVNDVATTGTHVGVYFVDNMRCRAVETYSTRNAVGILFDGTTPDGSRMCSLDNSQSIGNTSDGLQVLNGSIVAVSETSILSNGQHGIHLVSAAQVDIDGSCDISSNTNSGILSTAGCIIRVSDSRLVNNGDDDITAGGDLFANDLDLQGGSNNACINVTGAGDTVIDGCRIAPNPTNGALAQGVILGTGHHVLGDCLFILNGTGTKVGVNLNQAGNLEIDNCSAYGTGGAIGVNVVAGATVRRGSNVNFDGNGGWAVAGGAIMNFGDPTVGGQIISNGAGTLQTITAACGTSDIIVLVLTANAGATRAPQVVAGVGSFGFTAPAGDTSTYSWKVVS